MRGNSELQILKLEEDGSIDWRRTFDLQGHSFMNGRLHNSNDSKLLVSIHAMIGMKIVILLAGKNCRVMKPQQILSLLIILIRSLLETF